MRKLSTSHGKTVSSPTGSMPSQKSSSSFLGRMERANPDMIASAKKDDVRKVSSGFLLKQRLRIPMFQRRYCWGEIQWRRFFDDVSRGCLHSLGRVTCVIDEKDDGRLLIIDGQQRNTTTIMLLSAIRDSVVSDDERSTELITSINDVLCPDQKGLESWIAHAKKRRRSKKQEHLQVEAGELLDFTVMLPTYLDRAAFFAAILPENVGAHAELGSWMRPMDAKLFFMKQLQGCEEEKLFQLTETILNKLEWLFFPIDLSANDGTEDIQVVYERLALRDSTICRPHRENEYADMGAVDFIRNLLLGSFADECTAIRMYDCYWLPMERAADSSVIDGAVGDILEDMMNSFLSAQPHVSRLDHAKLKPQVDVGGHLYADFRGWFKSFLTENEKNDIETATIKALQRLHAFALAYFSQSSLPAKRQHKSKTSTPSRTVNLSVNPVNITKSRSCPYCNFTIPVTSSHCTSCLKPLS